METIQPLVQVPLRELPSYVQGLLAQLKNGATPAGATVVTLKGNLGAGKTTLVQTLATALGVTEGVTSPTFVIMKGYETTDETFVQLIHIDAYRIDSEAEMTPLRFDEILREPQTLVCIEWAERISSLIPAGAHHLSLSVIDELSREIAYEKN